MKHYSTKALNMLKGFEELKLKAYKCPAGKWTIGYGVTVWPNGIAVKEGEILVNEGGATRLLEQILEIYNFAINRLITTELNQNQYDALLLLSYNIGLGNFGRSTLLKQVNARRFKEAAAEFHRWVYGGDGQHNGKDDNGNGIVDEAGEKLKLPGLVVRRAKEATLFLS